MSRNTWTCFAKNTKIFLKFFPKVSKFWEIFSKNAKIFEKILKFYKKAGQFMKKSPKMHPCEPRMCFFVRFRARTFQEQNMQLHVFEGPSH